MFDLAETDAIPAFAAELRKSFGGVYDLESGAVTLV